LADLRVLDLQWNLAIGENEKCVLKTGDIPTLTNPSPPTQQRRFQSPLSATAHFANKNAAIRAVLLLFPTYHLFKLSPQLFPMAFKIRACPTLNFMT
jgi:hypothetical protein